MIRHLLKIIICIKGKRGIMLAELTVFTGNAGVDLVVSMLAAVIIVLICVKLDDKEYDVIRGAAMFLFVVALCCSLFAAGCNIFRLFGWLA